MAVAKVAVTIPAEVLEAAKKEVEAGHAKSLSAFVSDAVDEKLRRDELAEIAFAGGLGLAGVGMWQKSEIMQILGLVGVAVGGIPLVLAFDGTSNGPIASWPGSSFSNANRFISPRPPSAPSSTNITWHSGAWLGSRSGTSSATSCSNGISAWA